MRFPETDRGLENSATVLVEPSVLSALELDLMARDLRLWVVAHTDAFVDSRRIAFQIRRSMAEQNNRRWADAEDWTLVWITFGDSWRAGEDPLPWSAHEAVWDVLGEYGDRVRYRKWIGSVPRLRVPSDAP